MSIYLDKLAHVHVVINCQYSVAQMCTLEDTHAHLFLRAILDDVSQNEPTTKLLRRFKKEWRLKTIRGTEFNIKKSNAT